MLLPNVFNQVLPSDPLGGVLRYLCRGEKWPPFGLSNGHLEEAGGLFYLLPIFVATKNLEIKDHFKISTLKLLILDPY